MVAEHLGVGSEQLGPEVTLRDDLAADSLDLVELGLMLEEEFAIVVPEHLLEEVRTYSDLVRITGLLLARDAAETREPERPNAPLLDRPTTVTVAR